MAKRKLNAAMILAAGVDAHLQTNSKVSQAKLIDGQEFLEIDVDLISNNPMQPRIHIDNDELNDLARSIKLHGLIQPIAVIRAGDNQYILKAGQRRLLAHKSLGIQTIKAIVQEATMLPAFENDKALFEIAVMENTQRDNLNPLELALSLKQAMDRNLYKNLDELSLSLGKSKSYVSKILKVLLLDDEIIKDLSLHKSTNDIESLYEIQKIKDKTEQVRVYRDFISKKLDRNAIRGLNKKDVSQAKQIEPYTIQVNTKRLLLTIDMTKFDADKQKQIQEQLMKNIGQLIS